MKELSYQIGLLLGSNLANQVNPQDMDVEAMGQGIQAIFGMSATNEELQAASQAVQTYMQGIAAAQAAESVEQEKSFLEENAKREEIVSRESGLQYEVLVEGNGDIPTAKNTVVAHYEGRLLNGKVFDSSVLRGQPATFPVGNLIQGWQEALQLMPVGSKWRLYIPSALAYGANGAGNDIPPHSTLIFELELLSIQG
ncbi:FKBP-type peptidyl-prolyl cis-trans isomerase [Saprospira grandis]|uniref:Peptidyl-prolyl cis-trans isomerase n=1 Tax=Saprospira grandis (strain Lewin) TaxID=984262 RepID=H6L1E5_SAPGL|nr:FKBP-type peptidyl-prolyl cis-trans isomerase [Saprospira grandis]AFC23486.1 putative FkbP-type 22 kDa peptidyl-prolyl cis-trans isomerase [Saprospira grandis str. Lewin]WBM75158.1 FKBP-type peptidyl-prolyl cis-trans isomerase [Saprospira grandis]